jgi:hypothetical protein
MAQETVDITRASTDAAAKRKGRVCVAFDPGVKNLAVWRGVLDDDGRVVTEAWAKVDITKYVWENRREFESGEKGVWDDTASAGGSFAPPNVASDECLWHKGHGVYSCVVNMLVANRWMYRGADCVVVETQEPGNVPARIIASSIYSYVAGAAVEGGFDRTCVKFSGTASKATAKTYMASKLGVSFDPSECTGTADSSKAYRKTKSTSVQLCKLWVAEFGSEFDKLVMLSHSVSSGKPKGRKPKVDDLCEARILGMAELLCNVKRTRAPSKRKAKGRAASAVASIVRKRVVKVEGGDDGGESRSADEEESPGEVKIEERKVGEDAASKPASSKRGSESDARGKRRKRGALVSKLGEVVDIRKCFAEGARTGTRRAPSEVEEVVSRYVTAHRKSASV